MNPRQRTFWIGNVPGRHASFIDRGQIGADVQANFGGIAITRDEDQNGDIAVELVRAGQHANARALVQLQDGDGKVEQALPFDLEQLVTRESFQNVAEGAAGMAFRPVAGAGQNAGNLAAQERDGAGRFGIGGRGEQADDAQFAVHVAFVVIKLGADVIHVYAPVHGALHVALAMISGSGFFRNSRISGVICTNSVPRRRTRTSGSDKRPRPVPSWGESSPSSTPPSNMYSRMPRK